LLSAPEIAPNTIISAVNVTLSVMKYKYFAYFITDNATEKLHKTTYIKFPAYRIGTSAKRKKHNREYEGMTSLCDQLNTPF
jgi:hypothetical protein